MKKPVPLSHIQRKAKQLKKENPDLKYHHALDAAAESFGHSNYQNYKNARAEYKQWLSIALEKGAIFAMAEQDRQMAEKFNLVSPVFQNFQVPIRDIISMFQKKKHTDEEIQYVCEKELLLRKYLELYFLSDSLSNIDWDFITDAPYHIPDSAIVKNLIYKYGKNQFDETTDDGLLYIEGEYEILCKTIFEHTQQNIEERNDGFFDDCRMSGFFELTIDRDKNVTIENIDGGCDR